MKKGLIVLIVALQATAISALAQQKSLCQLQQEFVDLRFGMFIHFNMPTFFNEDWPDPDAPVEAFNPQNLDCSQWAKAAKSAGMTYGCLTTKHHSGFCIWNTETTDYSVGHGPFHRDVVKEYADAFRKEGLKVMLYYSILDTHARLRPGHITRQHIDMIKAQLTELLTNYGEITALIIDGWDAPWSRISYDDVPFEDIYRLVKRLQPNCLVMDLNAAKYPAEALFYTDIKSYEQGAGQHIGKDTNRLPALSCLPLQKNWFWKPTFPDTAVKSAERMVDDNIVPMGQAHCNFILNVAPNRDGLIDDNALQELKKIGKLWTQRGHVADVDEAPAPIISQNIAKFQPMEGSWSYDTAITDFANDDDFSSAWQSHSDVKEPWLQVILPREQAFNMIVITEQNGCPLGHYRLEYRESGEWKTLFEGDAITDLRVKIHRFDTVWGDAVRLTAEKGDAEVAIAELGVYCER